MAKSLWGKVYYQDQFAGILREEPGERFCFEYDAAYLAADNPAIAYTLPTTKATHISEQGLPAFFDNLVAEGWLEHAQTRLLGKRKVSRFELLLAFGFDCAGAVSVFDPEPNELSQIMLDVNDSKELAVLSSRASLSGVQAKLAVREQKQQFHPTAVNELSTHIAKFASLEHRDLIANEYLCTLMTKALLPNEAVVEVSLAEVVGVAEQALIIKRFDRDENLKRLHFEEFNQLLDLKASLKYEGSHQQMSAFIRDNGVCMPTDNYRLFQRILVGLLLGNTDMHFKNFAMLHHADRLSLAPIYDQVAAVCYQYKSIALQLAKVNNMQLGNLKPKYVIALGREFALSDDMIMLAVDSIEQHLAKAKQVLDDADVQAVNLKNNLLKIMEKRWNGSFALIGKNLLKKR